MHDYLLATSNMRPSLPIVTSELKSFLDEEEDRLYLNLALLNPNIIAQVSFVA
jgi:hypothetical protein